MTTDFTSDPATEPAEVTATGPALDKESADCVARHFPEPPAPLADWTRQEEAFTDPAPPLPAPIITRPADGPAPLKILLDESGAHYLDSEGKEFCLVEWDKLRAQDYGSNFDFWING